MNLYAMSLLLRTCNHVQEWVLRDVSRVVLASTTCAPFPPYGSTSSSWVSLFVEILALRLIGNCLGAPVQCTWDFTVEPGPMVRRGSGNPKVSTSQLALKLEDMRILVQTIGIQLSSLSTQVLSIMEITIQRRQASQQLQDECFALRNQLEDLQVHSGSGRSPNMTSESSIAALSPDVLPPLLDLNSPALGPTHTASGMKRHTPFN